VSLRLLPAATRRPAAWKNGGGSTTEVAAFPPGARLGDFDWRVSMAEVATAGPFSEFPGVDRTLCLLAGAGMTLHVAGVGEVSLTAASPACRFAGDAATSAELHHGPIADLNVMTRRDRFEHTLERFRLAGGAEIVGAPFTLILAPEGGLSVATATAELRLGAGDAALLDGNPARLAAAMAVEVFVIRFVPV
jgi:environmental stress-induced protein Ves